MSPTAVAADFCQDAFLVPLVDLGDYEDRAFAGILTPLPEVGAPREGISETFLGNAEEYYNRHQGFAYWRACLEHAFQFLELTSPSLILGYGCGFGNGTLPLLDIFPQARVIATDLSPNLQSILRRLTLSRGLDDRCVVVNLDAHRPYIKGGIADVVVGTAILHHLVDPGALIQAALRALKPQGVAVFFEPLELGYATIRLAIRDICREAEARTPAIDRLLRRVLRRRQLPAMLRPLQTMLGGGQSPAFTWLGYISGELRLQMQRQRLPGWSNLDDKWVFPRAVLQRYADENNAELILRPISPGQVEAPISTQIRNMLRDWRQLDPDDENVMPRWAWDTIRYYDEEAFSPEMGADILCEGCVIFRKRA